MKATSQPKVEVTPRSVYAYGKRKARVYDAELTIDGERFRATAKTRAEAIATVEADAHYVREAGRLEGHGCRLYAQGKGEWLFVLPSGGSMGFSATDLAAALAHVMEAYAYHEGCAAFFTECRATEAVKGP